MDTKTSDWSKKLPSQILFEAANALEEGDRWYKGNFFSHRNDQACFCAHGAIQYCGRGPEIRKRMEQGVAVHVVAASSGHATIISHSFPYKQKLYQTDPYLKPYYHLFLAHTFAHTVGCTFIFNDHLAQSKEEVVAKLREAAAYALEHQHEYL